MFIWDFRLLIYVMVMGKSVKTCITSRAVSIIFIIGSTVFSYCMWIDGVWNNDDTHLQALESYAYEQGKKNNLQDLKYILLWTSYKFEPLLSLSIGQRAFQNYNCAFKNCYITTRRSLLKGGVTEFDAIAFNGFNTLHNFFVRQYGINPLDLPRNRSEHQKYIYFNKESGANWPVCDKVFDAFFNWTATFRLDSDIPFTYITVKDLNGTIIGPKIDMQWNEQVEKHNGTIYYNKTKAVAWFVSNCLTKSRREKYVAELQEELSKYALKLDIYGECGPLKCPNNDQNVCGAMLQKDYFFYLSFENSFAKDYVTEKLLIAMQNDVVPIVYGGADYSRFLPPGSYIEAHKYSPRDLAGLIEKLIWSPSLYKKYFSWKKYYIIERASRKSYVCKVCEALNNGKKIKKKKVYNNFRSWWYPEFRERCDRNGKRRCNRTFKNK